MMTFLIILFTTLLILDCLILGLLILVQLPKKDAGVGMAFGGGAADALFGAGSGNTLTKLTKYTAAIFFVLVFLLSSMNIRARNSAGSNLRKAFGEQAPPPASPVTVTPTTPTNPTAPGTNSTVLDFKPAAAPGASNTVTNTGTNAPK